VTNEIDQSTVSNIFAIGDCAACVLGNPEMVSVAIDMGRLLADRLFGGSTKRMDYNFIAKCIFTPLEYCEVGMHEDVAI